MIYDIHLFQLQRINVYTKLIMKNIANIILGTKLTIDNE